MLSPFSGRDSASTDPAVRASRRDGALKLLVLGVAVPGLFCTVALPAYAYSGSGDPAETAAVAVDAQSLTLAAVAEVEFAERDDYDATSAAEMRRQALAAAYAAYSGPSVSDYLANPPYPNFSLDAVVAVAMKYQGVPYRFGGADPSGFDCSGFTQFVYSQFGVYLPHSSSAQGRMTAIAPSAALPGDLVVMDGGGHIGIYLGNGQMIDAPRPGTVVAVRPIYSANHWFVRPTA